MPGTLLIRADASKEIGTGHVMRCLALGQAWQDTGGKATFVMAMKSPSIETRLKSEGIGVVYLNENPGSMGDAIQTLAVTEQHNAQWIVVDGYQFDGNYQRRIKKSERKLLFIDDYGQAHQYCADIVLNQNLHAHENLYRRNETYTDLLLGTRFVLLRREFLKWKEWKREVPRVARRVLVTFGGGNDRTMTCKVIRALKEADLNDAEVTVIVGSTNPYLETIRNELMDSRLKSELLNGVDDVAALMASADIGISAAGTTSWELAFMGLPSFVLPLADNQVPIAKELNKEGVAIILDAQQMNSDCEIVSRIVALINSHDTRSTMTEKGRKLVDGEGVERILMHMRGEKLRLRKVQEADCKLFWKWANDPDVRKAALSMNPITWEEHEKWFLKKLREPNCHIFVGLDGEDLPVGQIRFDFKNNGKAEIDVHIDQTRRGYGYGSLLVDQGAKKLFRETAAKELYASIKAENLRSVAAFEGAKFRRLGSVTVGNNQVLHYVRSRDSGTEQTMMSDLSENSSPVCGRT